MAAMIRGILKAVSARRVMFVCLSVLCLLVAGRDASDSARLMIARNKIPVVAFLSRETDVSHLPPFVTMRGGATAEDSDDASTDAESESEDEDEEGILEVAKERTSVNLKKKKKQPISKIDSKLASSTLEKITRTKTKASKAAVNAKLAVSKKTPAAKRKSPRLPYVVRAFLNPVNVVKMTVAYWKSLVQLDYGKEDASQGLRSAMEAKARRQGGGSKRPPSQRRRGGQAKSLSDLPALST
jgi:hypothetical protein